MSPRFLSIRRPINSDIKPSRTQDSPSLLLNGRNTNLAGRDLGRLLPPELLTVIFELAAQGHHNFPAVAVVLCRYWRATALGHAPLWSYIWLNHRSPHKKYLKWTQRLGDLPIPRSIAVVAVAQAGYLTDWKFLPMELDRLQSNNIGIQSFHLDSDEEMFSWALRNLSLDTFPEVSLHVDDGCVTKRPPSRYPSSFFWPTHDSRDDRSTHSISLRGVLIHFPWIHVDNITKLEIFQTSNDTFPDPDSLMMALRNMPHLQTFALEFFEDLKIIDFSTYEPVRLENLRHLQLAGSWSTNSFLRSLEIPNLHSFVIDRAFDPPLMALSIIASAGKPPPLRRLSISRSTVNSRRFLERLTLFPSVTSVYVVDVTSHPIRVAWSEHRQKDPEFLSTLQHFDVYQRNGNCQDLLSMKGPGTDSGSYGSYVNRHMDVAGDEQERRCRAIFDLVMQRTSLYPACFQTIASSLERESRAASTRFVRHSSSGWRLWRK
ncbi:hypothetical protein SISSUDRAFT_1128083 [Sistotremastrum suecicum HHB10207 ss-3]|uniref:F-box domain-containing protein n=1 Tax=Sistotremastrum suecicum HHB10207 ss-3 TaxID=1314776 RepID=A0A166EA57_9AGAM|nr:hypothetical protein SISSUDRAFT_1128083 [Sistotremastrum suecicum HHB10207 ss-3]